MTAQEIDLPGDPMRHVVALSHLRNALGALAKSWQGDYYTDNCADDLIELLRECSITTDPDLWEVCDRNFITDPPCRREHGHGADGVRRHQIADGQS